MILLKKQKLTAPSSLSRDKKANLPREVTGAFQTHRKREERYSELSDQTLARGENTGGIFATLYTP
jgi:hypothetical protein